MNDGQSQKEKKIQPRKKAGNAAGFFRLYRRGKKEPVKISVEDILNSEHRPKISFYEEHILAIMKRLYFSEKNIL